MDTNIQRALNDKLYDKRKIGALECVPHLGTCCCYLYAKLTRSRLERVIRDLVASKDYQKVYDVLEQLCNDYAYAVHQPHARNGGLIGLAAAAIALGSVSDGRFHHLFPSTIQAVELGHLSSPEPRLNTHV